MSRDSRSASSAIVLSLLLLTTGCASFSSVRSAEVPPGVNLDLGASISRRPGQLARQILCREQLEICPPLGYHAGVSMGLASERGGPALELGAGYSGPSPYLDAYTQIARGRHPLGLGGRFGLDRSGWKDDALYARFDLQNYPGSRVMLNATYFNLRGVTPGGSRGSFEGFAPGIGVESRTDEGASVTLSLVWVVGRARMDEEVGNTQARRVTTSSPSFLVVGVSASVD